MAGTGVAIGLSNLHYALLTKDDATGVAYQTPKRLYGAISASENPNPETNSLFADDGPYETATTLGQIELALSIANIPLEDKSVMLGHTLSGGIMTSKSTDQPPWLAIGYQILKSNGKYEYRWLLKGKASETTEESETKGDSINYQSKNLTFAFVKRDFDDAWKREADADTPGFSNTVATNWFLDVEGNPVTTPVSFTTVPTNGATSVVVSDPITITSNVELDTNTITTTNIFVSTDTGAHVDGALTVSKDNKVITFTPKTPLTASTKHLIVVSTGVKTIYGQKLATPLIVDFTTA